MENKEMNQNDINQALELWKNLKNADYQATLTLISYHDKPTIYIHNTTDLIGIKKILGKCIITRHSQNATCTLPYVDITIFNWDKPFRGCRVIQREVLIPAQEEHYRTQDVIVCDRG